MRFFQRVWGAIATIACLSRTVLSQAVFTYKEPNTGIIFSTQTITDGTTGGFTFGYALPPNALTVDATEYIGYFVGTVTNGAGWSGISHSAGMPNSLLLMVWPNAGQILTSFRYASGYVAPDIYTGTATLTQIYSNINATHFTLVYRCQGCFNWNQGGDTGSSPSTGGVQLFSWCQNTEAPPDPSNVNGVLLVEHDNGEGIVPYYPSSATQASYSQWATLHVGSTTTAKGPTSTPAKTMTTTTVATATQTSSQFSSTPAPTGTYDYIVVGGGAGGIVAADKLSETGKSVLLIERGPPSSYRWGGRNAPAWLAGNNLTRYDVPGLCNEIWIDSAGIACPDIGTMSGCVLGGGTAINAGLWWNPVALDWDMNFPTGWKSTDLAPAISRVFSRIPGTYTPSLDGILYNPSGYNLIGKGLANGGWANVSANSVPSSKNRTFSHTPYMYSHGERGGPMATYLVTANARPNFHMLMNTMVSKVVRTGGHVTGVQVGATANGGSSGTINVTPVTGRVILSAGTFGSAKILMRSGIGPADQLAIVKGSADGPTMINSTDWISLPVGYNLDDHTNTDLVIRHPDVKFYDFYAAFNNPIASDASAYLSKRDGILAQAAPNIGPMFWESIYGADGIIRQLQYTARVEGPNGDNNGHHPIPLSPPPPTPNKNINTQKTPGTIPPTQNPPPGATSRGRAVISASLSMSIGTLPYLVDPNDTAAVIQSIQNLQAILNKIPGLTWVVPPPGQSAADYVHGLPIAISSRTANHWIGTAKMGTDDGRQNGGTAVVDVDTKVWGTDNLFVVDASIFPGMMSTNPSALIVSAAEHAVEKINALAANKALARYAQCGGSTYSGGMTCASPYRCVVQNAFYSQCV